MTRTIAARAPATMACEAVVYTAAPECWRGLYRQRLRWFRGTVQTLANHARAVHGSSQHQFQRLIVPSILRSVAIEIDDEDRHLVVDARLPAIGYKQVLDVVHLKRVYDVLLPGQLPWTVAERPDFHRLAKI